MSVGAQEMSILVVSPCWVSSAQRMEHSEDAIRPACHQAVWIVDLLPQSPSAPEPTEIGTKKVVTRRSHAVVVLCVSSAGSAQKHRPCVIPLQLIEHRGPQLCTQEGGMCRHKLPGTACSVGRPFRGSDACVRDARVPWDAGKTERQSAVYRRIGLLASPLPTASPCSGDLLRRCPVVRAPTLALHRRPSE